MRKGQHMLLESRVKLIGNKNALGSYHPQTAEHKTKIGKAMIGNKNALGYHWTPEQKEKFRAAMHIAMIGNKNHLGHRHTEEAKTKMKGHASWNKGLTKETDVRIAEYSIKMKGNKNALGYHWTPEQIVKNSTAHLGLNNGNWQNGKSFEPYGLEFNEILKGQIHNRDNHTCQNPDCFAPENGRKHHVHHIDYNKRNNDPTNLIMLCLNHHSQTNSGNRDCWTEYYQELQILRGIS